MSKELVIAAGSHERRVAIMEEGQLVEIYIEREKEFALVGSIYKGKVTRVLPGMQSAFVEIGLDGDAFLYVSDVFENLEDYDHGHAHDVPVSAPQSSSPAASTIELLPGETFETVASMAGRWEPIKKGLEDYVRSADLGDLERIIEYKNMQGKPFRYPLHALLQHVVNHGTYHRGQVATQLREIGAKPLSTDLLRYYDALAGLPVD